MNDIEEHFGDGGTFSINYELVMKQKDFQPSTRLLALDISNNGYYNVGDYFKSINDSDLQKLLNICEDSESPEFSEILLISELLATGEGLAPAESLQCYTDRTNQMILYLAMESLARKGLVRIFYENLSFGEDMHDKLIVEKIE